MGQISSKGSSYEHLMKHAGLLSKMPNGKTLIDTDKLKQLEKDNKRVGVLNIDTFFDGILKDIFMIRFSKRDKEIELFFDPNSGGALVSLTNKARLAYALGIIDKTALNDFKYIHKIRNEFAHSVDANFADTEVITFVKKLSTAKGKNVTAKNSYKCFQSSEDKCLECLDEALDRVDALRLGKENVQ